MRYIVPYKHDIFHIMELDKTLIRLVIHIMLQSSSTCMTTAV